MMGIPESEYQWVFDKTNVVLGASDPEYGGDIMQAFLAAQELWTFAQELRADRVANPRDDITTKLVEADEVARFGDHPRRWRLRTVAGRDGPPGGEIGKADGKADDDRDEGRQNERSSSEIGRRPLNSIRGPRFSVIAKRRARDAT